ncbi:MAG: C1 family peptidase [Candidatus Eremiobacterota bacterium]
MKHLICRKDIAFSMIVYIVVFLLTGCGGSETVVNPVIPTATPVASPTATPPWSVTLSDVQSAIAKDPDAKWIAGETSVTRIYTEDEARILCSLITGENNSGKDCIAVSSNVLPGSFSWRNYKGSNWMTSVCDQGLYGTGVVFASIGALEVMIRISRDDATLDVDLSEWYLWWNGTGGKNPVPGKWYLDVPGLFLTLTGTVSESDCPYSQIPDYTEPNQYITYYRATEYQYVSGKDSMKEAILAGPVVGGMKVYADFCYYKKGIYKHLTGNYLGDQAILLIGWDDIQNCWIAKNSWSSDWGDSGYFWIDYDEVRNYGYLYKGITVVEPVLEK